jgi:hypothetical protein
MTIKTQEQQAALKVRTGVRGGGLPMNHNERWTSWPGHGDLASRGGPARWSGVGVADRLGAVAGEGRSSSPTCRRAQRSAGRGSPPAPLLVEGCVSGAWSECLPGVREVT